MVREKTILCLTVALFAVAAGCDGAPSGSMVGLPPPLDWESELGRERAARDQSFRTSPETPLLAEDVATFTGLDYWPPDPGYYFVGPIRLYPHREEFQIVTTAGKTRPCEKLGWIEFPLGGQLRRLQVYRLLDSGAAGTDSLFLPFTDETSGRETYPSGRYLDLAGPPGEIRPVAGPGGQPMALGPYVLDFNRAYNPSCAYGSPERFACPVTPKDNRMGVAIEAGERGFKPDKPSGDG